MTDEKPFQRSTAQAHWKAAGTIGSATAAGADHDQVKQHGELLVAALHRAEADDLAEVLARAVACGGYTGRGCVDKIPRDPSSFRKRQVQKQLHGRHPLTGAPSSCRQFQKSCRCT